MDMYPVAAKKIVNSIGSGREGEKTLVLNRNEKS